MTALERTLSRIEACLNEGKYEPVETDRFELKPCPANNVEWREIAKSANAFLNTRGGILIIGVKEEQEPAGKKFIFTGYREDAEPKIKDLAQTLRLAQWTYQIIFRIREFWIFTKGELQLFMLMNFRRTRNIVFTTESATSDC
jgi:predicted HTH transcriptional regulator